MEGAAPTARRLFADGGSTNYDEPATALLLTRTLEFPDRLG
jgi:hypothetical protein